MSNLQRKVNALKGIKHFLNAQKIEGNVSKIMVKFLKENNLPYTKYNPNYKGLFTSDVCNAETIQQHFTEFRNYIYSHQTTNNV
jgi:hypothetical protein